MRIGRWAYIGSLTLVLSASTRVLHAQVAQTVQEDAALLDAGELAYAQGRFGDALDCFEASYRKHDEALTLRRIGDAADKLGSHARAIEALTSYLTRVPDARDRAFIESRIEANRAALASVRLQSLLTQPRSERSDGPRRAGPVWIWAAGGAVVVAAVVIAAVVITSGSSTSSGMPVRGNVGSAIQTLHFSP